MRARILTSALAALALVAAAAPAAVGPGPPAGPQLPAGARRHDGAPLTLDEAVELVQRRYDARVLRAEETREGEEVVYRIRLLAGDGRVFTVRVNARSGSVE